MSIKINLIDNNSNTQTILVETGSTFAEVLHSDEIIDLLDEDDIDVEDYDEYLLSINDTDVSANERLRDMLLDAEAKDGDTIELDVEFPADEEDVAEELGVDQSSSTATVSSAVGHATVSFSGGIITVPLAITPGLTTIAEALANNAVVARSQMTEAELANATVKMRGQFYETKEAREAAVLSDGAVIEVNPRQASNKG